MTLEKWNTGFEVGLESPDPNIRQVEIRPHTEAPRLSAPRATGTGPDVVEHLARELARAHGEDPDAQPYPQRFPCWHYYRARAKALLAITPKEQHALAKVLGGTGY